MPWISLTGKPSRWTPRVVTNMMRKRRYAWGKPVAEIANEVGLSYETILDVIKGKPMSDEVHARLVGYLKTPAGPYALINDRERKSYRRGARSRRYMIARRVDGMRSLAAAWGFRLGERSRLAAMSTDDLWVYFWNLDERVKNMLMERFPIASFYLLPDAMDAWEWIERLEKLNEKNPGSFSWPSSASTVSAPPQPTSLTARSLSAALGISSIPAGPPGERIPSSPSPARASASSRP